ncbi:BTB/POZ domain-containing protein 3-like protein [Aphelenchoides avenae]|nr:BTB/POZ domain-containing protein 3-like protein [Aphelenchus avenae]
MADYVDLPVKDRMKAFVLSEDMADVHFSVGLDGFKERLPAHKFILSTASEVFHGMLYRRFDVPESIEVDDTSPETFKLMLRHVYTDEVDLSPDNAFSLLYLAKQYLLKNLVAQILKYVATAYGDPSIVKVLPHLHLVDGENADSVWNVIGLYADIVLESPEFLDLSHAILCDLLRRDLNVDELTVYNSVVAWARAECQRKELSFATDARAVLGDALKLIRFPSMSIEEFASGPADSNLLSDKVSFTDLTGVVLRLPPQEKLELYKCPS